MKEKTAPLTAVFESRFAVNFRLTLSEISASKPQNAEAFAASSPAQPNPECSAFAKKAEASAAPSFFGKQRSKVIVRVTRKCLTDISGFPEHLAPAEGIDPENRSRWSQFLRSISNPSLRLPMVAFHFWLPITFNV